MDTEVEMPDEGDNIIRTHDLEYEPNPNGLGCELFAYMEKHKDLIAQIDAETGAKETYGSLLERSVRTAMKMRSRGVKLGDIITPCTYNHMDACVPVLASLFLGNKIASLDPSLPLGDMKALLRQVKPMVAFVTPDCEQLMEVALRDVLLETEIVVFGDTKKNTPFSEFQKPLRGERLFQPHEVKNDKDTAMIFFSSGTTGLPKGICINHYSLLSQVHRYEIPDDGSYINLSYTSLYWFSAVFILIQCMIAGGTRIVAKNFEAEKCWEYLHKYEVSSLVLSTYDLLTMLKMERPDYVNMGRLKSVASAGTPVSSDQALAFRKLFPGAFFLSPYGQTEACGVITGMKFDPEDALLMLQNSASCGRPIRGIWYKIVDVETGKIVGANQRGEIRIKSKFIMNGYHNLDASAAFDEDGWLKTGDICYYDENHCFYVVDRLKELMKYRSWHVPPALLEGILQLHPAVKLAVVIGVPHPEDGDHPLGLVQLMDDAKKVTAEELVEFVDGKVSERQRLRAGVRFVSEFPFTPSGKINRYALKRQILGSIIEIYVTSTDNVTLQDA